MVIMPIQNIIYLQRTVYRFGQRVGVRDLKLQSMLASEAQQKIKIIAEHDIKNLASYNPKLED